MILTIVQKFMRTVNERREDFEFNNVREEEPYEESKEDHYEYTQPKVQTPEKPKMPSKSSSIALKNNFMSPKEEVEEEPVEQTHPLKSQLLGCFTEMANSKAKYQITRPLSYCVSILQDSSVNCEECPLYISPSELEWMTKVL